MTGTGAATTARTAPPSAVIIHDLDQARRVLAAARRADLPAHLVSAPGAGAYLGPALFKEIIDQARAGEPTVRATACLDCGDEPGTALNALRHGVEAVSLAAALDVLAKVRDAAARVGAVLAPPPDRVLDMAEADADRRLDAWLRGDMDHG